MYGTVLVLHYYIMVQLVLHRDLVLFERNNMNSKIFSGIFFVTLVFSSTANLHGSWNQTYKNVTHELNKVIGKISPQWVAICSLISGLVISNIILYRNYLILRNGLAKTDTDASREIVKYARKTLRLEDNMKHIRTALLDAKISVNC